MSAAMRLAVATVALWLIPGGCAFGSRSAWPVNVRDCLLVNGERVPTAGAQDLLQLLRRKVTGQQIGEGSYRGGPLVLVDGVTMSDGVRSLAGLSVIEVVSVDVLRPVEAAARYGQAAGNGAIVVQTRRDHPGVGCAPA